GITESEDSNPEEFDDDIVLEQYETLADASSSFTIFCSSQIPAKRKNRLPIYKENQMKARCENTQNVIKLQSSNIAK
ncbi:28207_t:CDS:1, partial [Gigaspora margarita]